MSDAQKCRLRKNDGPGRQYFTYSILIFQVCQVSFVKLTKRKHKDFCESNRYFLMIGCSCKQKILGGNGAFIQCLSCISKCMFKSDEAVKYYNKH